MAAAISQRRGRTRNDSGSDGYAPEGREGIRYAGLLILCLLVYLPVLGHGYIWDDAAHVMENEGLHSVQGLWDIWFKLGTIQQYYPLVHTTFWLEYQAYGLWQPGLHMVNVLLQAANAILLWRLLVLLNVPGAWFAAAVFAVHPVHVESVAWISERKNVLSLLFYLSAAIAYFRFDPPGRSLEEVRPGARRLGLLYALSFLFFLLALLSKTVTSTLPAAILVVYWWKTGRVELRRAVPLVPFFVTGIMAGLLTIWLEVQLVGAKGEDWALTFFDRFLIAGRALWFYAGKLAWPANLIFIYPRWEINTGALWQWIFPVSALALIAALWLGRNRIGRGALAAVLFFAGTLFPALGFFNIFPMRFSFVADHFQYHASIGLHALFGAALVSLLHSKVPASGVRRGAMAGIIIALGIMTIVRLPAYRDEITLWVNTAKRNPRAFIAHNNLATLYENEGQIDLAVVHMREALRLRPEDPDYHFNLGNMLEKQGDLDGAEREFRDAFRIKPFYAAAHNNLGNVLQKQNRSAEAAAAYLEAIRIADNYPEPHFAMGNIMMERGDAPAAESFYQKALEIHPDYAEVRNNYANLLSGEGRTTEALTQFREAIRVSPNDPLARFNYGIILQQTGAPAQALPHLQEAARLNPGDIRIHYNLGVTLRALGKPSEAIQHFREALRLNPGLKPAMDRIAEIERELSRPS